MSVRAAAAALSLPPCLCGPVLAPAAARRVPARLLPLCRIFCPTQHSSLDRQTLTMHNQYSINKPPSILAGIYEFGNLGGLVVMAPHKAEGPTDVVYFSPDQVCSFAEIMLERQWGSHGAGGRLGWHTCLIAAPRVATHCKPHAARPPVALQGACWHKVQLPEAILVDNIR